MADESVTTEDHSVKEIVKAINSLEATIKLQHLQSLKLMRQIDRALRRQRNQRGIVNDLRIGID